MKARIATLKRCLVAGLIVPITAHEPGLADTRGAQHHHVSNALAERRPDIPLGELEPVKLGTTCTGGSGRAGFHQTSRDVMRSSQASDVCSKRASAQRAQS
ncbi:hypothetical protein [Burkholderia gladioli]|uniref:hypothetical protein n=1 Tax=Burkholderia gladioli TaxID=28095 RepID=UPI00227D4AFF|nr:hypothetical protein [Burkholderia gladioli]